MKTLRMLHSHVLVRLDERVKSTEGGLIIPETAQRQPKHGTVVAVGPGRWVPDKVERGEVQTHTFLPTELQVGDRVIVGSFNGWELTASKAPGLQGVKRVELDDGHQWWICESMPGVQMDHNPMHPGDVYMREEREGERAGADG